MIDNEETGQVEELDDIVVDLAEDEGKQPEETSDTESPITEEVEEETDKIEANDQEEISDDSPEEIKEESDEPCLLYTSPSPRDRTRYRMPSSA